MDVMKAHKTAQGVSSIATLPVFFWILLSFRQPKDALVAWIGGAWGDLAGVLFVCFAFVATLYCTVAIVEALEKTVYEYLKRKSK